MKALTYADLTPAEAKWLQGAVLATDNDTRKVRLSIEGIAEKAKVSRKTGSRAVSTGERRGYFERVDRYRDKKGRTITDLWFNPFPPARDNKSLVEDTGDKKSPVNVGQDRGRDGGQEVPPSTTSTPSTSLLPPCFCHGQPNCPDEQALDSETPSGPLPEEPLSLQGQAAEAQVDEKKPCGCPADGSCPTCRGDVVRPSRYGPKKLKEFRDRELRDEGLNEYGEPLGIDY